MLDLTIGPEPPTTELRQFLVKSSRLRGEPQNFFKQLLAVPKRNYH